MEYKYQLVSKKEALSTAKRLVVDSIWKAANIEVPGTTFPETNEIFEGRTPTNASVEKVVVVNNLKRAWEFLFENIDWPLDFQLISEYNHIIGETLFSNSGKVRTGIVAISGTKYIPEIPFLDNVNEEIRNLGTIENPIDRALEAFCLLCRSQWFENGNKRTAHLAANHLLIQANAGLLAIPEDERELFFTHFIDFYDTNDNQDLKNFLNDTAVGRFPSGLTPKREKEMI